MIKLGIGFATGRRGFLQVLKTYIYSCEEDGLVGNNDCSINVFVAYDLDYNNTKLTDYTNISEDVISRIDSIEFIDTESLDDDISHLIEEGVIEKEESLNLFGQGYAAKRNVILYKAIEKGMDYVVFLDDDEYPMAVSRGEKSAIWSGQHTLATHVEYIKDADITHGHHCGYISPIPYVEFDEKLNESDFKTFIEAISNDIINWDNLSKVMLNGGITYANTQLIINKECDEIQEKCKTKFISGANLCINVKKPGKVFPFYNPPGARGEDTFLSTCLSNRLVLSVPCYTFHDGFSTYNRLLEGVLPTNLVAAVKDDATVDRFLKACIGWVRYKPLLLYITKIKEYNNSILDMKNKLEYTVPKISKYFDRKEFLEIPSELEWYHMNVQVHHSDFQRLKYSWQKIMDYFEKER